jgi:hypothetical protein
MSEDFIITPLYVLKKLEEHQEECSQRWWAVMKAVIANLIAMVIGMGGLLVTLLMRGGH